MEVMSLIEVKTAVMQCCNNFILDFALKVFKKMKQKGNKKETSGKQNGGGEVDSKNQ